MKPCLSLLLLILLVSPAAAGTASRQVVIITVDGLRADAIAAAPALQIAKLAADGAVTLSAHPVTPSSTLPNHLSMATGLLPSHHGISTNRELRHEISVPTIFNWVHAVGGRTGLYYGKPKLLALAPACCRDIAAGPDPGNSHWSRGASAALAARFAGDFAQQNLTFAWIHLRDPDLAGHRRGWMSPAYLAAVRSTDAAVGVILRAVADSGKAATTAVILTSDHGGENRAHRGRHANDRIIPWICRAPGVAPGTKIRSPVSAEDTAPTLLALLGIPPVQGLDGKAVAACLPPGN